MMGTSTEVKVTEGGCCCDGLPPCCDGFSIPDELCMAISPPDTWCPAFPRRIRLTRTVETNWVGYYCIEECNKQIKVTLSCGVLPDTSQYMHLGVYFDGVGVWFASSDLVRPGKVFLFCDPFLVNGNMYAELLGFLDLVNDSLCCTGHDPALSRNIPFTISDTTGTAYGTGSGTYDCPPVSLCFDGTGTGTGTQGCPCPTDSVFCADDGTQQVELTYSTECLWAGSGSPAILFDPSQGMVRRGVYPANFADYQGDVGCAGGTYTKVLQTGVGPHPDILTVSVGECPGTGTGTALDCGDCVNTPATMTFSSTALNAHYTSLNGDWSLSKGALECQWRSGVTYPYWIMNPDFTLVGHLNATDTVTFTLASSWSDGACCGNATFLYSSFTGTDPGLMVGVDILLVTGVGGGC